MIPPVSEKVKGLLAASYDGRIIVERSAGTDREIETDPTHKEDCPYYQEHERIWQHHSHYRSDAAVLLVFLCEGHDEGKVGDGKIIITPVEDVIRIRTGETGEEAI